MKEEEFISGAEGKENFGDKKSFPDAEDPKEGKLSEGNGRESKDVKAEARI